MITTTLFKIIQSELIKQGFNEFVDDDGKLIFFDSDQQFMTKIFNYDEDIKKIVDDLFLGYSLDDPENDDHFKKTFLYRFINRQINRQTKESFQLELVNIFLTNQDFLNRVYQDLDQFITGSSQTDQQNNQVNDGTTTTDNRQAFADLPQNSVNIDVDDSVMTSASDNTINRNKQTNKQATDGSTTSTSKSFQLDQLLSTNGLMEQIFLNFDQKCFLQIW